MNETFANLFDGAMDRTVTVAGPNGSPAVKVKLIHAAAVAIAGVLLAPRATAVGAIAAMIKGVSVKVDRIDPA